MKTLEKSLWRWLSGARRVGFHLERVENTLSRSTPDVECSTGGGGFWIELKTAAAPKRKGTLVRFRFQPGQSDWLIDRYTLDRGAWLLVQVGSKRYLVAGLYARILEDGATEAQIRALSMTGENATAEEAVIVASGLLHRQEKISG